MTNTPTQWPQPLQRSRLAGFTLEDLRVQVNADRARATFTATVAMRTDGGQSTLRSSMEAQAEKNGSGHWRIDYSTLVAGQPQLFR